LGRISVVPQPHGIETAGFYCFDKTGDNPVWISIQFLDIIVGAVIALSL
jgi:hypothetical protein